QAKLAVQRGAMAVIFDITDDASAADQLFGNSDLPRPVVLIRGKDAELLMDVVNKNREAKVRIEVKETPADWWPGYDMGISITLVIAVLVIVLLIAVRSRCRHNRTQDSLQQQTIRAISRLEIRKYKSRCKTGGHIHHSGQDSGSSCSSAPVCAICLEEFIEGQDLRIITCFHEFHKECVDPWLLQHRTCPLCMHNIIEGDAIPRHLSHSRSPTNVEHNQQVHFLRQYPGHAHLYRHTTTFPTRAYHQSNSRSATAQNPNMGHYFFNPEVYQIDFNTMRTNPHRRPPPWADQQYLQRTCVPQHRATCLGQQVPQTVKHHSTHSRGVHHGRQEDGSCSGGSFRTERSGYLPDGPGSDSSSGPCHGSSSDSVLNCTDVSLQGVYGSWSTFRSSLSSDYDPFVYCSQGKQNTEKGDDQSLKETRPRSLDSVVNRAGSIPEDQVFSHVHYHHHRHHHYRDGKQNATRNSKPASDNIIVPEQRPIRTHHCQLEPECGPQSQLAPHSGRTPFLSQGDLAEFSVQRGNTQEERSEVNEVLLNGTPLLPCCSEPGCSTNRHQRRKRSCRHDPSAVYLHQGFDMPEDCSVHIHYGHSASYCCTPEIQPLVPVPLVLDAGIARDHSLACCMAPEAVW
uniref:RING-type E3 ubiquitin transferase n=1 Tax=Latimeria chalumnae TaxID=7897 RepID=H3B9B5_LATCH